MKKADVKVGSVYGAKVSGKVVPVRIDAESARGGWTGTNQATRKQVRIKSAQRLRYAMEQKDGKWRRVAARGGKKGRGGTKAKASKKKATRAKRGREGAKRASCLDAAAQVLADADGPMNCKEMVGAMLDRGLWQTDGKTPSATLYSAILRETQRKGKDARFKKVGRGQFALAK